MGLKSYLEKQDAAEFITFLWLLRVNFRSFTNSLILHENKVSGFSLQEDLRSPKGQIFLTTK